VQCRRGPATVTEESDASNATGDQVTGKAASGDDAEARRPAYFNGTAVPTGDREVLKMQAIEQMIEGPL